MTTDDTTFRTGRRGPPLTPTMASLASRLHAATALTPAVFAGVVLSPLPALAQDVVSPPVIGRQVAQAEPARYFAIRSQPLATALDRFSEQTGISFAYATSDLAGVRSPGVTGELTPRQALTRLLKGTGVTFRFTSASAVTLSNLSAQEGGPMVLAQIAIEGSTDAPSPSQDPVNGYKADYATTGTRSRMAVKETPQSIGVVTGNLIKDTFSLTMGDALENVSGVSRGVSSGRKEKFLIRGFGFSDSATAAFNGVRENGLPIASEFNVDPALIERYEVLKGPASIVGGASSPGGVVNRITKTPQNENFARVEGRGGSYGLKRGIVDVNGVALENQRLRGRLVAAVQDDGEFVDDVDFRQITVAPSAEVDLFDGAAMLRLVGRYQDFDGSSNLGFPLLENGQAPDVSVTTNIGGGVDNGAFTHFDSDGAQLHYEHHFLDSLTLSAKAGYEHSDYEELDMYSFRYGGIPLNGDTYISAGYRNTQTESYAGEIYLSKEFSLLGQQHEILVGADYRNQTQTFLSGYQYLGTDNINNLQNNFQAPPIDQIIDSPLFNGQTSLEQTGLFGQLVIRPFDRLTLVAAGRHDWAQIENLNRITGTIQADDPTAFTGRVGATFELMPWLNVYGGYQESFEPNVTSITVNNELLPPERGESYEVGFKVEAFDGRLGGSIALFRTYRQNVPTIDPDNPRFSLANGEQRHQGVELDLQGAPMPGLELSASLSYLDAEVTESNIAGFEGNAPQLAPVDYVGRIWATYTFQSGLLQNFGFGGGTYFHGGFQLDSTDNLKSDSYVRSDAVAFYRPVKNVELQVNVRNLTNEVYLEGPSSVAGFNRFGAPRSIFGTVKVKF